MSAIGYHASLDELTAAADLTRCGLLCLPVPLADPQSGAGVWDRLEGRARRAHRRFVWRQHALLADRIRANPGRPVLVREFSTWPFLFRAPRLFRERGRILLLVNHNLQWAVRGAVQRLGFRLLERLGFRFLFLETGDLAPLRDWGFRMARHGVLPFCSAGLPEPRPDPGSGPLRIGLAGQYRREKGMDEALRELLDEQTGEWILRVGVPDPGDFLSRSPAAARRDGFELVNTAEPAAFRAFLRSCDVLVLNYDPAAYAYRPSGLVADAAAAGLPVVLRDLPVQRVQVSAPVPVGDVRRAGESWARAALRVAAAGRTGAYDFAAYARARAREPLARALDGIVGEKPCR